MEFTCSEEGWLIRPIEEMAEV